jgi:hypothetical protein
LSDLHIGLNNDPRPAIQAKKIIDAIISTYSESKDSYEYPRPIIVITGDLVDYYSPDHLYTAFDLLQQLTQQGFTVLLVPGNHDYSDSFSTDSFTPLLESLPGTGDLIKLAARLANAYVSNGQNHNLVSGMTFIPDAARKFQEKIIGYLGENGAHLDRWKDKGAVYDLDFILLDGQDKNPNRPDWDDPRRFVREKVRDAVLAFENSSVGVLRKPLWDIFKLKKDELADRIGDAVANLALDPLTIKAATFATVQSIEKIVFEPWKALAISLALGSGDPILISVAFTGNVIYEMMDFGLAEAVSNIAAAAVAVPPLDAKFFLGNGNFRLAHGYLDTTSLQSFRGRVDKREPQTLSIACIHYWLKYPRMDAQDIDHSEHDTHSLVNENDLFDILDKCHLLLVGHIHEDQHGRTHTFQTSTREKTLGYYSRAGSTLPYPRDWDDDKNMKDRQKWLELTVNLNTGEILSPFIVKLDGKRYPLL